jgi:ATP-binding cassette subfamily B protein
LLGLVAIRSHGGERAMRREHESVLTDWGRAGRSLVRRYVTGESVQSLVSFGLVIWLLIDFLGRTTDVTRSLLFLYWALNLPMLGQEIVIIARQYPGFRSVVLRLLEPLQAHEVDDRQAATTTLDQPVVRADGHLDGAARRNGTASHPLPVARTRGVSIAMHTVTVRAGGQEILREIELEVPSGGHVAIVGASGAGKSSLLGLLLGWHRPASGQLLIDGRALDARHLEQLRRETAWVDPDIQLWNRTLLDNVLYGSRPGDPASLAQLTADAHLHELLQSLPDGLQSLLGEGGALVSGGEGQRVRFARALARPAPRLVILDEPFRGLDREKRRGLLARAREVWRSATLLCVTHDVADTVQFPRVLVIAHGRIVEDGDPLALLAREGSIFRALHAAEREVSESLWCSTRWRRVRLQDGLLAARTPEVVS